MACEGERRRRVARCDGSSRWDDKWMWMVEVALEDGEIANIGYLGWCGKQSDESVKIWNEETEEDCFCIEQWRLGTVCDLRLGR